jgi:hypothetical protein
MAKNTKNTTANKTNNKTTANAAVNSVVQSEAISELTALVRSLMQEISELKAKANIVSVPDNKTPVVPNKVMPKVNVVPANRFILLAENTTISELVSISSIGTPFSSKWGARQAVNCVTASGNTVVVFVNCVRDALGNTIPSGLIGGANYVLSGVASGKTSEFNGITSNIINKGKFSQA